MVARDVFCVMNRIEEKSLAYVNYNDNLQENYLNPNRCKQEKQS